MADLTAHQKSFVEEMCKSPEHARRGFGLLTKRELFIDFFDALSAKGLFAPEHNPAPTPADLDGMVRVPYWDALSYLGGCARVAGTTSDLVLAEQVMTVIRDVSAFRENEGSVRDNYHTFREFAVILGLLPLSIISRVDIALIPSWLSSRFNRDGVAHALDEGLLGRLLASEAPEDWEKAHSVLSYCLKVRWEKQGTGSWATEEPVMVVDSYWIHELLARHSLALGRRNGGGAASILREGVREVFSRGGRAKWSSIFRPAVEDHSQNRDWRSPENCVVDGLRDVLLNWGDVDPIGMKSFVAALIADDCEMLQRIGIFIMRSRWELFSDIDLAQVGPAFFSIGHLHELYGLLSSHFEGFSEDQKASTLRAIREIRVPEGDDAEATLRQLQLRWLTALSDTSYEPAATWLAALRAQPDIGISEHPDFTSYMESSWGPGPTPYQVPELVALAEEGRLAQILDAFVPEHRMRGPTADALCDALESAVVSSPQAFIKSLPSLTVVAPAYQTSVIRGFKRVWETPAPEQRTMNWLEAWQALLDYFTKLLSAPVVPPVADSDNSQVIDWLLTAMADLLHSGTRDDGHAYPPELLPHGWAILTHCVERASSAAEISADPMTQAINTPKGRVLEAIFGHVLRECRLADKAVGAHRDAWTARQPAFDREIERIEAGNYEFLTLSGAYVANLDYLSPEWLSQNLQRLFPSDKPDRLTCAVGGLAYCASTHRVYGLLRDANVLDRALDLDVLPPHSRKRLVERIALGYLWAEDTLDSARMTGLFATDDSEDIEAALWFFWSAHREQLHGDQVALIIAFWRQCVEWAQEQASPPAKVFAQSANLACYLKDVSGPHGELLLAVAPFVNAKHGANDFVAELIRLVDSNPEKIAAVVGRMLETFEPFYDYDDRLKILLLRLAELGQRAAALAFCERLRNLPGIDDLYRRLTEGAGV
jgi:hypothetical protein